MTLAKPISDQKLADVIALHQLWIKDKSTGARADLSNKNLAGKNLSGVNLSGANLAGAILNRANLTGACFIDANLYKATMISSICIDSNFDSANLSEADLTGAILISADMHNAYLVAANLTKANLSRASLIKADLTRANLDNAVFHRANLACSILNNNNLMQTVGDSLYIKTINADRYIVVYTAEVMQIGCIQYPIADWFNLTDTDIEDMDVEVLEWAKIWKPVLLEILKNSYCPVLNNTVEEERKQKKLLKFLISVEC